MKVIFEIFTYIVLALSIFFIIYNIKKHKEINATLCMQSNIGLKTIIKIILFVVLSRVILFAFSYACTQLIDGAEWRTLTDIWNEWDAPHYIHIIESGYYDSELGWIWIVFYPLYPFASWIVNIIIGNAHWSALLISWIFLCGAAIYLYKLALIDHDKKTAIRTVKFFLIFPATVFYGAPYTESMFIFFCFAVMYYTRSQKYSMACVLAGLAALTRNIGVLLAIIIFAEMLYKYKRNWKPLLRESIKLLIIPLCAAAYLFMNHLICGDSLAFLKFQEEYWHQCFGSYGNTLNTTYNGIASNDFLYFWIPQFIVLIIGGITLPLIARKVRTSYALYAIAYIFILFAPTWLLSGLRYYSGLAIIYPILGEITHKKWINISATVLSIILMLAATCLYSVGWMVL